MASWTAGYSLRPNRKDKRRGAIAPQRGKQCPPSGSDVYMVYMVYSVLYLFFTQFIVKGDRHTKEGFYTVYTVYTVYTGSGILGFRRR